jgi:creatinine amidohydrolase
MRRLLVSSWTVSCVVAASAPSAARVLEVATLNTEQIRALDQQRTVVILPGGVLEQHGPYLPSYADGYFNERVARDLADAVVARPGWTALLFPSIPLGVGGANEIGRKYAFPGTFAVRAATLRAVFMDLADELGELGFRWVFVVHGHGGFHHNRALDDAGRYFQDTYGGRMVHLLGGAGLMTCCEGWKSLLPPQALKEDGFTVHAGLGESSAILFLRPDLVPSAIQQAPSQTAADFAALEAVARTADWPGYFGAPRHASAAAGAAMYREEAHHVIEHALKVLDGQGGAPGPRRADAIVQNPISRGIALDSGADEAAREARQRAWLVKQPAWPPAAAPKQ